MSNVGLQRQSLSLGLSLVLIFATVGSETDASAYQTQGPPPATSNGSSSDYPGQGTPESAEQLQSLVAPIALYPDALVAQILNAATFPDQVAVANYWMQQNKNLAGSALATAVNGQSWDPSVKALTEFPSVLNNMAQNLSWTSQLGEAYHNQQSEVMSAIQTLRAQAKAAGNLKSGPQITVVQQSPQTIVIQPTNPQVVYVPQYNPTVVYGTSYVVPGYSTADLVATGLLSFGAGMAVGAMMSGGCCGWGYSSWNCNWYGGGAYYHGAPYYGNNAWHGGYNNYGYHPYNNGYNKSGYHTNYNGGYNSTGSDPGKQNGLYWESAEGQPRSPVGPLVAFATDEGYNIKSAPHQAFHGYFFRILDEQGADAKGGAKDYIVNGKMTGGFAYVAYPATYNDTGVMTFIINQQRVVYQRNLGTGTADQAKAITEFNPDKSWTALQ